MKITKSLFIIVSVLILTCCLCRYIIYINQNETVDQILDSDNDLIIQLKDAVNQNLTLDEIKKKVTYTYGISTDRDRDKRLIRIMNIDNDPDHIGESINMTDSDLFICWFLDKPVLGGCKIVGIIFDKHQKPKMFYGIYRGKS